MFKNLLTLSGIIILSVGLVASATSMDLDSAEEDLRNVLIGVVIDKDSGDRLADVEVEVETEGVTESTNENGAFVFDSVEPGNHTVVVEAEGFERFEETVEIPEGGERLEVRLTPSY